MIYMKIIKNEFTDDWEEILEKTISDYNIDSEKIDDAQIDLLFSEYFGYYTYTKNLDKH